MSHQIDPPAITALTVLQCITSLSNRFQVIQFADGSIRTEGTLTIKTAFGDKLTFLTTNTYKVHGGAFQPAAHLGWVELVLAPCYRKGCHCSGLQKQKWRKRKRIKKFPQSLSALNQWVQQKPTRWQQSDSLYCSGGPLMEGSTSGVSLTWGREVHLAGFSKHSSVAHGLCT